MDIAGVPLVLPGFVTSLRDHQAQAMTEIITALDSRKVVFLDAPTGAGKTIIGEGVRQVMATRTQFGPEISKAIYLCTTKSLQDQFLHDFPRAKLIKGRANYFTLDQPDLFFIEGPRHLDASMCTKKKFDLVDDDLPICSQCEDSLPDLSLDERSSGDRDKTTFSHCHHCHPHQYCPYTLAKTAALGAELAVANTAYFLTEANGPGAFGLQKRTNGPDKPKFGMMVIDEADTIEKVLMSYVELSLSKRALRKLDLNLPKLKTKPESWLDWVEASQKKIVTQHKEAVSLLQSYHKDAPPLDLRREADSLERYVYQFDRVANALRAEPDNWVYDGYDEGNLQLKPVLVASHTREILWKHSTKFLLMSATMISPHQMAEDLGLLPDEWESVVVDSNFPVERRPVWVMPRASMTWKNKDTSWPIMATSLEEVLALHPSERVLVHTHSYALTHYLVDHLRVTEFGRRVLSYDNAQARESTLETFKNRADAILLAPSLDRGIDLKDDLCRVIVIVKVPYPSTADKQVEKRLWSTRTGQGWYFTETVRSLVQMTGRGMRHENDYCVSYILDSQFASNIWTSGFAKSRIPRWWTAALKWEPPKRPGS